MIADVLAHIRVGPPVGPTEADAEQLAASLRRLGADEQAIGQLAPAAGR